MSNRQWTGWNGFKHVRLILRSSLSCYTWRQMYNSNKLLWELPVVLSTLKAHWATLKHPLKRRRRLLFSPRTFLVSQCPECKLVRWEGWNQQVHCKMPLHPTHFQTLQVIVAYIQVMRIWNIVGVFCTLFFTAPFYTPKVGVSTHKHQGIWTHVKVLQFFLKLSNCFRKCLGTGLRV